MLILNSTHNSTILETRYNQNNIISQNIKIWINVTKLKISQGLSCQSLTRLICLSRNVRKSVDPISPFLDQTTNQQFREIQSIDN